MNREQQIEEIVEVIRDTIGEYRMNDPYETAEALYNANYRKMDKVTLKLDLGDRTPEQINEIMEKFSKAAETSSCVAVPNNEEQIRKQVAKEILTAIKDIDDDGEPFKNYYWFERLCKQYGVEVDE